MVCFRLPKQFVSAFTGGALIALTMAAPAWAESRSFVVTWFGQAMNSQDGDCPDGVNPRWAEQRLNNLRNLGMPEAEIAALVKENWPAKTAWKPARSPT